MKNCFAIRGATTVEIDNPAEMDEAIMKLAGDGDVVVTMGAGSVGGVPGRLKARAGVSVA